MLKKNSILDNNVDIFDINEELYQFLFDIRENNVSQNILTNQNLLDDMISNDVLIYSK